MVNNTQIANVDIEWIPCGFNWTGPELGGKTPRINENIPITITGYIACAIAAILYGCNYIPLKYVKAGDGVFCQWVVCASAWLVGLAVQLVRGEPQFYSLTAIGGMVWAVGNCCAVPIINLIGLSAGVMLWNCTAILIGWSSSRFGLVFHMCPKVPSNEHMNYAGVALCLCSVIMFAFLRTEMQILKKCIPESEDDDTELRENATSPHSINKRRKSRNRNEAARRPNCIDLKNKEEAQTATPIMTSMTEVVNSPFIGGPRHRIGEDESVQETPTINETTNEMAPLEYPHHLYQHHQARRSESQMSYLQRLSLLSGDEFLGNLPEKWRRCIGVTLALSSGCCYGLAFVPWNYVREHTVLKGYRAARSGLDYVFTQYCGILLMSTIIMVTYSLFHKTPVIHAAIIVPSFVSGVMWGVATVALFVANEILSVAITFPIVNTLPGVITAFLGIFLYHEISGIRSYIILVVATTLAIIGVILTGWSKQFVFSL